MSVISDIAGQGTLTGSGTQNVIRTAASTESHTLTFINVTTNTVTLKVWVNGTADQNLLLPKTFSLDGTDRASVQIAALKLGTGDVVRAEAGAGSSIVWTDEMDALQ